LLQEGAALFERPELGERALLVHFRFNKQDEAAPASDIEFADIQREFMELCLSAGCEVIDIITANRHAPDPKYFIGKGKAEELAMLVSSGDADLVIFNHALSPAQERNLEKLLQCRVLDRTGLILDIFAQRARSFEGKLQVELAQLRHLSTRLVRGWTHLERQKGGIGLRGPGETQLETDRRLIGHRIKRLVSRLEKVSGQREQGRRSRHKAETPTVALVGYTNAGKSTLFNLMTNGEVYAADQLFATLDPTLRRVDLRGGSHLVIADTVGFIRDLPHDLVAAFRSTLAETRDADLLLHIVDAAREDRDDCIGQVHQVLDQIGAAERPELMVYNKADLIQKEPVIDRDENGKPVRVWLSAQTGDGIELLRDVLTEIFRRQRHHGWLLLNPDEAALRAQLYQRKVVVSESADDKGNMLFELDIHDRDLHEIGIAERFSTEAEALRIAG